MAVGKELKRIREMNKINGRPMSVARLAEYLSVTPGKLRKWEDHDTTPKRADLKKIEDYFFLRDISELAKIGNFKFYTKEITRENGTISYENIKLETLLGKIEERLIRIESVQKVLFQEVAEIKAKEKNTSISRELHELSSTIDAGVRDVLSQLHTKR